jgi:hypothetical protein
MFLAENDEFGIYKQAIREFSTKIVVGAITVLDEATKATSSLFAE